MNKELLSKMADMLDLTVESDMSAVTADEIVGGVSEMLRAISEDKTQTINIVNNG